MNLYGWETAYATPQSAANRRLAAEAGSLIEDFTYTEQAESLKGKFGTWSISGGSAQGLNVSMPIVSGDFDAGSLGSPKLDGITIEVFVPLQFVASADDPGVQSLTFDFGDGSSPGGVSITHVDDPNHSLNDFLEGKFAMAMTMCLAAEASKISFAFARIDPQAAGAPAWLTPKASAYCYTRPAQSPEGYLVILSQVTTSNITGLTPQFDPSLMKRGDDVCLALAGDLFLKHVVGPAFPSAFGVKPDHVKFGHAEHQVVGKGPVNLPSVKAGLINYHPKLEKVTAEIADDDLSLTAYCSQNLTMGWDTVYAVRYSVVNEAIARSGASPQSFSQSWDDGASSISGEFGDWSLTLGGSGPRLMMSVPITTGTLNLSGEEPIPFHDPPVEILVEAEFLPNPDTKLLDLTLRASGQSPVTVQQVTSGPTLVQMMLPHHLQTWMNANLSEFNYVFASVDINLKAENAGGQARTTRVLVRSPPSISLACRPDAYQRGR